MITARIFKGDDYTGTPSSEASEPMSFEQARKDFCMWLAGCPDSVLNVLLGEGGLIHIEDSEDESKACQWHWKNRQITVYRDGNQTVLIR